MKYLYSYLSNPCCYPRRQSLINDNAFLSTSVAVDCNNHQRRSIGATVVDQRSTSRLTSVDFGKPTNDHRFHQRKRHSTTATAAGTIQSSGIYRSNRNDNRIDRRLSITNQETLLTDDEKHQSRSLRMKKCEQEERVNIL